MEDAGLLDHHAKDSMFESKNNNVIIKTKDSMHSSAASFGRISQQIRLIGRSSVE